MSKQPGIPEEQLRACLQDQYELYPVTLEFLPIGKDYNAGVYRVVNEQGRASLLKVTSRSLDVASCLVPHYLRNQGITSVVAPIPTRSGALWTKIGDWTAIVYPFIDGDTSLTGMTDAQWKEVGTTFKQIHQVRLEQRIQGSDQRLIAQERIVSAAGSSNPAPVESIANQRV